MWVGSVSALTDGPQARLPAAPYASGVEPTLNLQTPAERIAWAIDRSGKTLQQLGEEIGCSHAALSQWQNGETAAANIKAGLLQAFADRTGTDVRWLLTGNGPIVSRYVLRHEMQRISTALDAMERRAPQQVETVIRMVEAAAGVTSES